MTQKLIFANLLNQLMLGSPEEAYARGMNAVTPRKIWLANEGDIVVTPVPISNVFKEYSSSLLNIDSNKIITFCPSGSQVEYLSDRITKDPCYDDLVSEVKRNSFQMLCFAYDRPILTFANNLNVPLVGYNNFPSEEVIDWCYRLNTKSGFRETAIVLGFKIVEGVSCNGFDSLVSYTKEFLSLFKKIIIKFDRSSNGYGHLILDLKEINLSEIEIILDKHLNKYPQQPHNFTIEKYINFVALPSVELHVEEKEAKILYVCDQRCPNASYSGMITPPFHLEKKIIAKLEEIGNTFGNYVHSLGYRGTCDVDTCLTEDGILYVTETNFRRTAGTFIDFLVKRLIGEDFYSDYVWLQDAKVGKTKKTFKEGIDLIYSSGLAFNNKNKSGVILYTDTVEIDGKWRYLIIENDNKKAEEIEKKLSGVLNFSL